MKAFYLSSILGLSILVSCKEEQKPKVKYDTTTVKKETVLDTSKLEIADLPIQFQGSNVLLFPIGEFKVGDSRNNYELERNAEKMNFHVSNSLEEEITGFIRNIKFQEVASDSLQVLTDKTVMIERVSFLKNKKLLVYVLSDSDTNQDNNTDSDDIKSLYLSTEMGKNFTKISPDVQELMDWNYIESVGKIFYRTMEDANKNGAFDSKDKFHYYYVKVTDPTWTAKEYFPIP